MNGLRRSIRLVGFYGFLWWVLSEGNPAQWWFGVIVIALAVLATLAASSHPSTYLPIRIMALTKLIPVFLYQSFKGGIQVAIAAFHPFRRVRPYFAKLEIRIQESDGFAANVLATIMCLMPGTVSCRVRENTILFHVLDENLMNLREVRLLERLVAAVFAREVASGSADTGVTRVQPE